MGGVEADDSLVNPLTRGRSIVHVLQLGNVMSQGVGMLEHNAGFTSPGRTKVHTVYRTLIREGDRFPITLAQYEVIQTVGFATGG